MTTPIDRVHDPDRLAVLRRSALLEATADAAFDRLTRLATRLLGAPVALVSLVDDERQVFKGAVGLPEPWASRRETPLSHSFCQHVVAAAEPLVVEDARRHPLVCDNLAIPDLGVVAYAGAPLVTADGHVLGSFCAIDRTPRGWTAEDLATLRDLAATAMTEIDLRAAVRAGEEELEARRAVEQTYRHLFEGVADPIFVFDEAGRLTDANRAALSTFGYEMDEVRRSTMSDLCADPGWADAEFGRLREEGNWAGEFEAKRHDGSTFPVEARTRRVSLTGGDVYLAVFRDASDRRAAERLQQEFIDAAAHDLGNPLTAIRAQAQLLRRRARRGAVPPPARLAEDVAGIEAGAERMATLLEELQDAVRLRAGQPLELRVGSTDLVALARAAAADAQATTGRHAVRVGAAEAALVAPVDAPRLRRVLDNLLANALKYSPNGGRVTLAVRREEGPGGARAVLSVTDQGVGIPAADLPHVFEHFRRGSNVEGRFRGTGIGLAGSRRIVEQHGGTLGVTSEEGAGSTFTVSLPLAPVPVERGA